MLRHSPKPIVTSIVIAAFCVVEARADCPSNSDTIRARADAVYRAWAAQDRDEYPRQRDSLFKELACLDEVIDTEVAARVHLVVAMDAHMARREDDARAALRSVVAIEPELDIGRIVVLPPGFDKWLRETERSRTGTTHSVTGSWAFDGFQTDQRPSDRPTVAQQLGAQGLPTWSALVTASDPLPEQSLAADSRYSGKLAARLRTDSRIWWTASGVTAVVATGFWLGTARAGAAHEADLARYSDEGYLPKSERSEVEATVRRANTLGRAAQGFTLVSAGCGIVALTLKY